ncbi:MULTISPECIES: oleate hydratase [unclassified Streptomyces]|uniref:oleate hydratase n=1 Tax=unclassified Streptomyces TaxID=2593676 RepID=UPI003319E40A
MAKAHLVGAGIASLSAAALLIREGGFSGGDITVLEAQDRTGGSLDAAGDPETGYWCTTFAFEPWHSAIEFRRYLYRFIHLFKTFDTMSGIYRTRFNSPPRTWCSSPTT